jgi:two-component system CheB/CheR fusion protein
MLVEDDFILRIAMAELLQSRGHDVVCAASGLDAIDVLTSAAPRPAVIILDIMTPSANGIAFRALRTTASAAAIPLVVLTGNRDISPAAKRLGVRRARRKMVDTSELLAIIDRLASPERLAH